MTCFTAPVCFTKANVQNECNVSPCAIQHGLVLYCTHVLLVFVPHPISFAAKGFQLNKCVGQSYVGHLLCNFGAQIHSLLSMAGRKCFAIVYTQHCR